MSEQEYSSDTSVGEAIKKFPKDVLKEMDFDEYFKLQGKFESLKKEQKQISQLVPPPLVSYVEAKRIELTLAAIAANQFKKGQHHAFGSVGQIESYRQALGIYEIQDQLAQPIPQYDKLKKHLEEEFDKATKYQETLQTELKEGFSDDRLPNGDGYFDLRDKRIGIQEIKKSLSDPIKKIFLDKVDNDWKNQQQGMKRGKKMIEVSKNHARITQFQQLRQLVPQPAPGAK